MFGRWALLLLPCAMCFVAPPRCATATLPKLQTLKACSNVPRSPPVLAVAPVDEVQVILGQSANWNFVLVAVALAFGGVFEFAVETLEELVPRRLLPVVQQSVVELATLGFVGLIIETIQTGRTGQILGEISERFLNQEEFLVERFEELHESLFDVTIIYFTVCAFLILRVTSQFYEWDVERRNSYLKFKLAE